MNMGEETEEPFWVCSSDSSGTQAGNCRYDAGKARGRTVDFCLAHLNTAAVSMFMSRQVMNILRDKDTRH